MDISLRERGTYRFGPFHLDPTRRSLRRDDAPVKLAERLFDTLLYLVVNQGRLVERDELLQAVWGGRAVEENNLAQAIFALRKVLQTADATERYIVTMPARGYRFAAPVVFEPDAAPFAGESSLPAFSPDAAPPRAAAKRHHPGLLAVCAIAILLGGIGAVRWLRPAPSGDIAQTGDVPFAPPAHSVAVLAFDNLTGDANQAYFSDGLAEQLIDSLTRVDAIQVAGRMSSFSFRARHATAGEIGRALNVSAVLAGSVRRSGGRVVVNAALTNTLTGFNMWSNSYDRDVGDIVNVENEIAQAVVQSLQVKLLGGEADKLTLGGTSNAAAYDLFLQGMQKAHIAKDAADQRAALAFFDRALTLDPNFARAHNGRSTSLSNIAIQDAVGSSQAQHELFKEALASADRTVALAPGWGQAHSARAWALNFGFMDHAGAEREMVQAQMLLPGSSAIEGNYANIELSLGHVDVAVIAATRGTQIDPLSIHSWGQLGRILFMARRYDAAVEALHHAAAITDHLPVGYVGLLGGVLIMQGHPDAARTLCAAAANLEEKEVLAIADQKLNRQAEAEANLDKLRSDQGDAGAFSYAEIYAQWGQTTEALNWLETAARLHDPGATETAIDPMLDPIRGEAKFKQIATELAVSSTH